MNVNWNSPDFEGRGWRIFRDYLWENSGFGNSPEITGNIDRNFEKTEDIMKVSGIKEGLFEDYYRDTCDITKSNMIAFLEANAMYGIKPSLADSLAETHVFVGGKEDNVMRKSAKLIQQTLKESSLEVLPGLYHGEFSINHADDYVRKLLEIVKQR